MLRNLQVIFLLSAFVAFLFLSSCVEDEKVKEDNDPPMIFKARLMPSSPKPGDKLKTLVEINDLELDAVDLEYKWFINGDESEEYSGTSISTDDLGEDTEVYFKVMAKEKDSDLTSKWKKSNTVVLGEASPPKPEGVSISPEKIYTDTDVTAEVDYGNLDPMDFDAIYYRWMVNRKVVLEGEDESVLSSDNFRKGDEIFVRMGGSASFDEDYTVNSKAYPVQNSHPMVESTDSSLEGDVVVITADAYDPDGDELNFEVIRAPRGTSARVQGQTLIITVPRPEQRGTYQVSYTVSDGQGRGQDIRTSFTIR